MRRVFVCILGSICRGGGILPLYYPVTQNIMTDDQEEKKELIIDDVHDAGDDNAIQTAMLENLEKHYQEELARGDEHATVTKEDIDALKAHMHTDAMHDPMDTTPDDLSVR
jgi:hypothetical protein